MAARTSNGRLATVEERCTRRRCQQVGANASGVSPVLLAAPIRCRWPTGENPRLINGPCGAAPNAIPRAVHFSRLWVQLPTSSGIQSQIAAWVTTCTRRSPGIMRAADAVELSTIAAWLPGGEKAGHSSRISGRGAVPAHCPVAVSVSTGVRSRGRPVTWAQARSRAGWPPTAHRRSFLFTGVLEHARQRTSWAIRHPMRRAIFTPILVVKYKKLEVDLDVLRSQRLSSLSGIV